MTACPVGMLLKGEVLGSRLTNNLIMELEKIHNRGLESVRCSAVSLGSKGQVVPTGRIVT